MHFLGGVEWATSRDVGAYTTVLGSTLDIGDVPVAV